MGIVTREVKNGRESVSINLTKPFLVWMLVFGVLAYWQHSWTLLWIALIPMYFVCIFIILALVVMVFWLVSGQEVTLTNDWTGSKKKFRRKK